MAFTTIATGLIATGEPTTNTLMTVIKDDLDDINGRLSTVEGAANVYTPMFFTVYGNGQVKDGLSIWRVPFNITILGARFYIFETQGTVAGSLTIDIEKKVGAAAFVTVLSSVITTSSGTLNAMNSGTVLVNTALAGDFIRLNQDAVMTGCLGYQVVFEYQKA